MSLGAGIGALAVSGLIAQGASSYMQYEADENAAKVDTEVAQYNANYDEAMAQQLDLDTQQNIDNQRQDNQAYLSKQRASYAAAGVIATSGSAMATQVTNAGRMEQQLQQEWVNANQQEEAYYSQAKVGLLEGQAEAYADRTSASLALIDGGVSMTRSLVSGLNTGVFSGLIGTDDEAAGETDYLAGGN